MDEPMRGLEKGPTVDATQFDALIRTIDTHTRRRAALGVLGGALTAILARGEREETAAKSRKPKNGCKKGKTACGKTCCPKGKTCAGGECVVAQGSCPARADSCAKNVICNDNPDCLCYQRLEGGVRCVQFKLDLGACDQCKSDRDCIALGFPPGSSCIKDDGNNCNCDADKRGYCGEPCGFVPPEDEP
jgi:hypothetical protein